LELDLGPNGYRESEAEIGSLGYQLQGVHMFSCNKAGQKHSAYHNETIWIADDK
jgi:hypothetical protein